IDDSNDLVHRVFQYIVLHDSIKYRRRAQLVHRSFESLEKRRRRLALPLQQTLYQDPRGAWENEDHHGVRVRLTHLLRPDDLDVQENMSARCEDLLDLALQCAVPLAGVLRCLNEPTLFSPIRKLFAREEVIRLAFLLVQPRTTSGRRNGVPILRGIPLEDRSRNRRLPASRRRGQDDDPRRHSKFSSCSRNFSSSPFIPITDCAITASLAFEPIVFTSRSSSCPKNPSCLPTAASVASAARHAARCVRSRTSSSVMSTRSAISAISTARRCSPPGPPAASSATAFFNRVSSATRRSGARLSTACAAA